MLNFWHSAVVQNIHFSNIEEELDGVDRPFTNYHHHFIKTKHVTRDMRHVEGGEYCLKISGLKLLWIGNEGVLKIFEQNNDWPTESITKVFVEQPRLHRVC